MVRKSGGTPKKQETVQPPKQFDLHEWYYTSLLICFTGIVGCYSYYAYL